MVLTPEQKQFMLQNFQAEQQLGAVGGVFEGEQFKFIKYLLEDGSSPQKIKDDFWIYQDRNLKLTKLTPIDQQKMMLQMDDAILAKLMSKPDYEYTFAEEADLAQLKSSVLATLKRSEGGFERLAEVTQIKSVILDEQTVQKPRGGIIGSLGKALNIGRGNK